MGYFDGLEAPGSIQSGDPAVMEGGGYFPGLEAPTLTQIPDIGESLMSTDKGPVHRRFGPQSFDRFPGIHPSLMTPGEDGGYQPQVRVPLPQHLMGETEVGAGEGTGGFLKGTARVFKLIEKYLPPVPGNLTMSRNPSGFYENNPILNESARRMLGMAPYDAAKTEREIQADPVYRAGGAITRSVKEAYPVDPVYDKQVLAGMLPRTVGRLVPGLATGAVAGPAAGIAVSTSDMADSVAQEAIDAGRPDLAQTAFAAAAPVTAVTEALLGVPERFLQAGRAARGGWLRAALIGALREGSQEGLEQAGQNVVARNVAGYDPDRPYLQGVPESAAVGALVGAPISALGRKIAMDQERAAAGPWPIDIGGTSRPATPPPVQPMPRGLDYVWPGEIVGQPSSTKSEGGRRTPFSEPIDVTPGQGQLPGPSGNPKLMIDRNANPVPQQLLTGDPIVDRWLREQHFRRQEPNFPEKRPSYEVPMIDRPAVTIQDPEGGIQMPWSPRLGIPEVTSEPGTPAPAVYDPTAGAREMLDRSARKTNRRIRMLDAESNREVGPGPAPLLMPEAWPEPKPINPPGSILRYGVDLRPFRDANAYEYSPELGGPPAASPVKAVKAPVATAVPAPPAPPLMQTASRGVVLPDVPVPAAVLAPELPSAPEASTRRKIGNAERITDKTESIRQPLTAQQAAVVAKLGKAKPGSPEERLVQFVSTDLPTVVEDAAARYAPLVPEAADAIRDRVFQDAVAFLMKKKEFRNGPGYFGAAASARFHALNAGKASRTDKGKVTRGSVSIDAPSTKNPSVTVGDSVQQESMDPAQELQNREMKQALSPAMQQVLGGLIAEHEAAGTGLALKAVYNWAFQGEEPKLSAYPKDQRKLITDPKFKEGVIQKVRDQLKGILGDDLFEELRRTRHHQVDPSGSSIGDAAVRSAAEEILGVSPLPEHFQLVNHPDDLTPDGKRWDGQMDIGPQGYTVRLNVPNISSPQQVRELLVHEGVHAAWDDPSVQKAKQVLFDTMDRTGGYGATEEERIEEATAESVTDSFKSNDVKSAWRRLVDTIWKAIKRLFGINPPESENAKSILVAAGLRSLKSSRSRVTPDGHLVRYSAYDQTFKSQKEVAESLSYPGLSVSQQQDIHGAASATGDLVAPTLQTQMKDLLTAKLPNGRIDHISRHAGILLRPLIRIGDMAGQGGNTSTDIAARSVLEADAAVGQWRDGLDNKVVMARDKLASIAANLPRKAQLDIEALMAQSMADQIMRGYRDFLIAEQRLSAAASNLNARRVNALKQAELLLGSLKQASPRAVPAALEAIAGRMPTSIHDELALHAWLASDQRNGWLSFGGVQPMTDAVFNFLVMGDPANGVAPAILNTPALMGRLNDLQLIMKDKAHAQAVRAQFTAFMQGLGAQVKSGVSANQMGKQYAKFVAAHAKASQLASAISDQFDRADIAMRSLLKARGIADQVQATPEYRTTLGWAAEALDQRARGVITYGEDADRRLNGSFRVVGPLSGGTYDFSYSPDKKSVDANIRNAQNLMGEVQAFIANPDSDPGRVQLYRDRVLPDIIGKWLSDIASSMLGAGDQPHVPIISPHWIFKQPFRAWRSGLDMLQHAFPGTHPREIVYRAVGGEAGRSLVSYMGRTDIAAQAIRNADNSPVHGTAKQHATALKAATQHGYVNHGVAVAGVNTGVRFGRGGKTAAQGVVQWSDEILNPFFAANQNPGQAAMHVGDYSPYGKVITDADLRAAQAQKAYKDSLQNQVKAGEHYLTTVHPAQREIRSGEKGYFRNETNYGLKMARVESRFSKKFSRLWEVAMGSDEEASAAAGFPIYSARLELLDENPDLFQFAVNGYWSTTSPEYWHANPDKVQRAVALELGADRKRPHTFYPSPPLPGSPVNPATGKVDADPLRDFQDYFGEKRSDKINAAAGVPTTTPDIEREHALARFMEDMNDAVKAVLGHGIDQETLGRDAEGVGSALADVTSVRSSLNTPRGRMVAPDPFYEYTITEDGSRMKYNASMMLHFQKQELELLRAVLAGLRKHQVVLQSEYDKAVPPSGPAQRFKNEMQYRRARAKEIESGQTITRLQDLNRIISVLTHTEKGMVANMQAADLDDNMILSILRPLETTVSVLKLLSPTVQYANLLSAAYIAPIANAFTIDHGMMGLVNAMYTTARVSGLGARQLYRATADIADSLGVGEVFKKYPDAMFGMARSIHESAMKRHAQLDYLRSAGFVVPETFGQSFKRWAQDMKLPESGGMINRDDAVRPIGHPALGLLRLMTAPFSLAANMGGHWTAAGETVGSVIQDELNAQDIENLKPDIIRAFDLRRTNPKMPDWNDTSKPLRPFQPKELGFNTFKSLNEWRRKFAVAGALENVFLDFYLRAKAAGPGGLSEPLVPDPIMRAIRLDMQKSGNIISDSGKPDAMKRKGWPGAISAALFRFQQYPFMQLSFMDDRTMQDPRDVGVGKNLRLMGNGAAMLAAVGALIVAGLAGKQWWNEEFTGKVPSQTTLTAFANDPSMLNAAKIALAGGGNLIMPYWGDALNRLIGGQSQRPGMDLAQIVPGIGAAFQVGDFFRKTAQMQSASLPALDLTKQLFPATESFLNRLPGVSEDLISQNAGRAIRSAAPGDMELKPQGGGNARATPVTPYIRQALRAAVAGDQAGFNSKVGEAVRVKMEMSGSTEADARKAVLSSIKGRNPIRLAVGRELSPDEESRLLSGMTPSQSQAYRQTQGAYQAIGAWTGTRKAPRTGRSGRGTRGVGRLGRARQSSVSGRRRRRTGGRVRASIMAA